MQDWQTSSDTGLPERDAADDCLLNATIHLVRTYKRSNSVFQYDPDKNLRRVLTKPEEPAHNSGYDNVDHNYILHVNDVLEAPNGTGTYIVVDVLGTGTFGQVVKCLHKESNTHVAVKIIKNLSAYFRQAWMEVYILDHIQKNADKAAGTPSIVKLYNYFVYRQHLCLVFETLSINLFELIKHNNYRGLDLGRVRHIIHQILTTVRMLADIRIVHCDLKPENILLCSEQDLKIKVIDFGSACKEGEIVYSYVQSRFYRAPEVLLGAKYGTQIDMWSLGCIACEIMLGLPIFPGHSEQNMIARIVEMLGYPSDNMLNRCKHSSKYFKLRSSCPNVYMPSNVENSSSYVIKSDAEFAVEQGGSATDSPPQSWKRYFKETTLRGVIMGYPYRDSNGGTNIYPTRRDIEERECFVAFVQSLLTIDPDQRSKPNEALKHPFTLGMTLNEYAIRVNNIPASPSLFTGLTTSRSELEYVRNQQSVHQRQNSQLYQTQQMQQQQQQQQQPPPLQVQQLPQYQQPPPLQVQQLQPQQQAILQQPLQYSQHAGTRHAISAQRSVSGSGASPRVDAIFLTKSTSGNVSFDHLGAPATASMDPASNLYLPGGGLECSPVRKPGDAYLRGPSSSQRATNDSEPPNPVEVQQQQYANYARTHSASEPAFPSHEAEASYRGTAFLGGSGSGSGSGGGGGGVTSGYVMRPGFVRAGQGYNNQSNYSPMMSHGNSGVIEGYRPDVPSDVGADADTANSVANFGQEATISASISASIWDGGDAGQMNNNNSNFVANEGMSNNANMFEQMSRSNSLGNNDSYGNNAILHRQQLQQLYQLRLQQQRHHLQQQQQQLFQFYQQQQERYQQRFAIPASQLENGLRIESDLSTLGMDYNSMVDFFAWSGNNRNNSFNNQYMESDGRKNDSGMPGAGENLVSDVRTPKMTPARDIDRNKRMDQPPLYQQNLSVAPGGGSYLEASHMPGNADMMNNQAFQLPLSTRMSVQRASPATGTPMMSSPQHQYQHQPSAQYVRMGGSPRAAGMESSFSLTKSIHNTTTNANPVAETNNGILASTRMHDYGSSSGHGMSHPTGVAETSIGILASTRIHDPYIHIKASPAAGETNPGNLAASRIHEYAPVGSMQKAPIYNQILDVGHHGHDGGDSGVGGSSNPNSSTFVPGSNLIDLSVSSLLNNSSVAAAASNQSINPNFALSPEDASGFYP